MKLAGRGRRFATATEPPGRWPGQLADLAATLQLMPTVSWRRLSLTSPLPAEGCVGSFPTVLPRAILPSDTPLMEGLPMPQRLRLSLLWAAIAALSACSSSQRAEPETQPAPASARASEGTGDTRSTAARLGIPPGHLPPPGSCRVWIPGKPPGHQAKAGPCESVSRSAPPGSWVVYRPTADRKVVHVREIDSKRTGAVVRVRIFDAVSGAFLRDE